MDMELSWSAERSLEERMDKRARAGRPRGEAGFSMVEALIAAAILLIIAIGMIPLFARSMVNNALGSDYTQATTFSKTNIEKIQKAPFESKDITLTAGTSLQRVDYVEKTATQGTPVTDRDWAYTVTNNNALIWTRTTRVRQFKATAVDDGVLLDTEAAPAGADPQDWQIKEVSSVLDSGKRKAGVQSPLASIGQTTFQIMKPY
jgi:Tfp pilus assembly major pilin PilA